MNGGDGDDNVVPIGKAASSNPLALIRRRRQNIAVRRQQCDNEIRALRTEMNALYAEDQELAAAEDAVRKLLERRD